MILSLMFFLTRSTWFSYNKLAFLDVSGIRANGNKMETSVYRKATCRIIYINWRSHVPSNWKISTLRNLIKRAKSRSSFELLLRNEIGSLRYIFTEYNDFPQKVVNNIMDQELSQSAQQETTKPQSKETQQTLQLMVHYSGNHSQKLLSKMKQTVKENTTRWCKHNDILQEYETAEQISS